MCRLGVAQSLRVHYCGADTQARPVLLQSGNAHLKTRQQNQVVGMRLVGSG